MAEKGQRIEGYDSAIEFIETTEETGGERVVIEIFYEGTGIMPPTHFHPNQDEHFEVLSGEVLGVVDGKDVTLKPGDTLDIPAGTAHQMWCEEPTRQRWTTTPALKTERFFETMWGLQQDGKTGDGPMPSLPQTALTLRRFSDEFRLSSPPGPLQDLLTMPLAALAKLAGKSAEYKPET
jgi:mannose-6-phosphate isomerase-like protein (cupin superfamily)